MLWRGMTRRCPWCGGGKLFRHWLRMRDRCPRCALRLEPEEGAFLGALALNYGVTGAAVIGLLVAWLAVTLPDVHVLPLTVAGVVVAVAVPILFFPFSKTIWVAVDLLLHQVDPHDAASMARAFGSNDPGER